MKQYLIFSGILIIFSIHMAFGQAPELMKYQAVARDQAGASIKNQPVTLRISILASSPSGDLVFSELHSKMTNEFGIISLEIGSGSQQQGILSQISWGEDDYFIQLEMDIAGGNDFKLMGSSQLLTVPYAFFANNGVQFNQDLDCNESTEGMIRYNFESKTIEVCNGESWMQLGASSTAFSCGNPLIDNRDGQSYSTVQIGGQCWMKDNLNFGTYKESIFTNDSHSDVSNNGVVEKYAYDNDESNFEIYGALYDWNELMNYSMTEGGQGICPNGWHVPSYDDYVELVEASGDWNLAGKTLKTGGSSGFEFRLSGNRREKGNFTGGNDTTGSLWTSTNSGSHPDSRAWNIYFIKAGDNAAKATDVMSTGKSCRCVKD